MQSTPHLPIGTFTYFPNHFKVFDISQSPIVCGRCGCHGLLRNLTAAEQIPSDSPIITGSLITRIGNFA